jgi:hypothetical protein
MEIIAVPGQDRYKVLFFDASPAEMARAKRILDAAVLQIRDRPAELFTGPPPANTNPHDIDNYQH